MTSSPSGHRTVPHTADLRLEAWAPTREECIAEAVLGLVESFADVSSARAHRVVTFTVAEEAAEDMLLKVLDEVIYQLDVQGEVPIDVETEATDDRLELRLAMAGTDEVESVGAAPKAVSLNGLHCAAEGGRWTCSVTVDV